MDNPKNLLADDRRFNKTLIGFVSVIFAASTLAALGSKGLWIDEIEQAFCVLRPSFGKLLHFLHVNGAGNVLHDTLLWFVTRIFGHSLFIMRLPSMIFSVLALFSALRFYRRILPPSVAALSFVMLASAPLFVFNATDGRGYAMLTFFVLEWYRLIMDSADGIKRRPVWHVLLPSLVLFSHPLGATALLAAWCWLLVEARARRGVFADGKPLLILKRWAVLHAVGVALYIPFFFAMYHLAMEGVYDSLNFPPLIRVWIQTVIFIAGFNTKMLLLLELMVFIGIPIFLWSVIRLFIDRPRAAAQLSIFLFVPVAALNIAYMIAHKGGYSTRYLTFALPAFVGFIAYAVIENIQSSLFPFFEKGSEFKGCSATLVGSFARLFFTAVSIIFLIGWFISAGVNLTAERTDFKGVYQHVVQSNPSAVFTPGAAYWGVRYYNTMNRGNLNIVGTNSLARAEKLFASNPDVAFVEFIDLDKLYMKRTQEFLLMVQPKQMRFKGLMGDFVAGRTNGYVLLNQVRFKLDPWGKNPRKVRCSPDGKCEIPLYTTGTSVDTFVVTMRGENGEPVPGRIETRSRVFNIKGSGDIVEIEPGGIWMPVTIEAKEPVTLTIRRETPYVFIDDTTTDRGNWVRNNFLEWMKDID